MVGLGETVHPLEFGVKQFDTLREIFFGVDFNRQGQARRSHRGERLGGKQVVIEVAIPAATGHRQITGPQTLTQLRQHASL